MAKQHVSAYVFRDYGMLAASGNRETLNLVELLHFVCGMQVPLEPIVLALPGVLNDVPLQTAPTVWQRPGLLAQPKWF